MNERPSAWCSWVTLVVGTVLLVVLAALLVPWHPYPGHRVVPVPADQVFSATQLRRAHDYTTPVRLLGYASLALSLVVLAGLGFTRQGGRLAGRLRGPWWLRVIEAVVLVDLLVRVLTLPFSILIRHEQRRYGLTHESWSGFATDLLTSELLELLTTALALVALLVVVRRWQRSWPLVAGLLAAGLVLAGSFVYPIVVEPLFNHFTPLPAGPLRSGILALAAQEHVHVGDVLVADASKRTTTLNAYVSGFGSTRRVVLYDTTVADLPRDQTLSVVAHELGHARHDDVLHGSLIGAAGALAAMGLLGLLGARRRDGLRAPSAVPFLLAAYAVASLLASPVENVMSRQIETRADVAALRTTHDPGAFVALQKQLAVHALSDPAPPALSQFWFGSHPTVLARIALAARVP